MSHVFCLALRFCRWLPTLSTHFLFWAPCKCLLKRNLSRFLISQEWLQAHLEIIKDLLLVGLRNGEFVELDSCHEDRFTADGRQAFDDVAHCPLSIFVGAISGKQGLQALLKMPLQIIGKGAQKHVASDPVVSLVKDRTHFELHGLEIAEGLFDQTQLLVRSNHFDGRHLLLGHIATDNVAAVKESFGSDLILVKAP